MRLAAKVQRQAERDQARKPLSSHAGPSRAQDRPSVGTAPVQAQPLGVPQHLQLSQPVQRMELDENELAPSATGGATIQPKSLVQRAIYYTPKNKRFEIDNKRIGWIGIWGGKAPTGQTRNHIVPFEAIQNDLCLKLNAILKSNTSTTRHDLIDYTETLFLGSSPERTGMRKRRTRLLAALQKGLTSKYQTSARMLLSALNSSPDNVRWGHAGLNSSIGENLDADFQPGTTAYGGQNVLTLTPSSNSLLYGYQSHTDRTLSFVLDPTTNRQLSSGTSPTTGSGLPVLVTDPTKQGQPFLFT